MITRETLENYARLLGARCTVEIQPDLYVVQVTHEAYPEVAEHVLLHSTNRGVSYHISELSDEHPRPIATNLKAMLMFDEFLGFNELDNLSLDLEDLV